MTSRHYWLIIIFVTVWLLVGCTQAPTENLQATAEVIATQTDLITTIAANNIQPTVAIVTETAIPTTINIATSTLVKATETPMPTATPIIHIVAEGDTLSGIATIYNTTVAAIQAANNLAQSDFILLGMELIIPNPDSVAIAPTIELTIANTPLSSEGSVTATAVANTPPPTESNNPTAHVITSSYWGNPIEVYSIGDGPKDVVFVGGIHGGYEWNTILLAYEALDMFVADPGLVPLGITLHIIPNANPDGLSKVSSKTGRFTINDLAADTTSGRTNGNNVDLNRNWDCNWREQGVWRDNPISGGVQPFSETETAGLKTYLETMNPAVVIFYHSAANGVFASSCPDVYAPSMTLANVYGAAAGYPVYEKFEFYEVTGDAGDYLSLMEIPSISIELRTHESLDWNQNVKGMLALLTHINEN